MLPVLALIGRPNVGKSTLFNAMTGTRDALVADFPGLTRDRQYGFSRRTDVPCIVVDTGGLVENADEIEGLMVAQTERAIAEADRLIVLVDGRAGMTPQDQFVAQLARRSGKPTLLAVNKTEGFDQDIAVAEFHQLGLGEPHPIAAAHDQGTISLLEAALEGFTPDPADGPELTGIKVAVIGRPNVGKSTLINRLLGENRMVAFDQPGTTRDAVMVPFERDGERYTLIDTAGLRRQARVEGAIEKFSVIKTMQAIETAHVVVALVDAHDNVVEQDASLLGTVIEQGRALVLAVNKWDNIPTEQRDLIRSQIEQRLAIRRFRAAAFHLRPPRQRRRRVARRGAQGIRRGDPRHGHAGIDARARGGDRKPSTAAGERTAHQAALRASGRPQSAGDRDSRQSNRSRARCLPALSRQRVSQGVRSRRARRYG